MTEEGAYGKKIEYDPLWQGPLQKRRETTDICCSIVLGIFVVAWLVIAVFAFSTGSVQNLLPPVDTEGRRCGVDVDVAKEPYLLFYDLTKCNNKTCPTTQSCLPKCPKTNFLYQGNENLNDIKPKLICKMGVDVQSINSMGVVDRYMQEEKCAKMYMESKSIFHRCVPKRIPDEFRNKISNETLVKLQKFIDFSVDGQSTIVSVLKGLSNTKFIIIGLILVAAVFSMLYLFMMRWLTKFFVYFSIFLVCAVIFFFICQSAMIYSSNKNRTDALVGLIVFVILIVVIILFVIFFWRRINVACEVIKQSCKASLALPSTLAFPLLPFVLYVIIALLAGAVGIYLSTIEKAIFRVKLTNDGCTCPPELNYVQNALCDPKTFLDKCKIASGKCFDSGCRFLNSTTPGYVSFMHAYNGFAFLWLVSFVSAFGHLVLAGTFATWYWTYNKKHVPSFTLFNFMGLTARYHVGSLALGSLILTIARCISQMVENMKNKAGERNAAWEILSCIVDMIEGCLKFLTRYTYIMIAVHGRNFFSSAKDAFNLLMRNILNVLIINKITDCVLFFGVILITGLSIAFAWLTTSNSYFEEGQPDDKAIELVVLIISVGLGALFISWMVIEVLRTAIDTIFICFLEDCERNDGSEERPYFMAFKLRELLQKQ